MVYILNGGTTVQLLSMSSTDASYIPLSGANYSVSTLLSPATAYSYYFTAQDEWGLAAGIPTTIQTGPSVVEAVAPQISFTNETNYTGTGVYPIFGNRNTTFYFHVMYADSYPPASGYPQVNILSGGTTVYCIGMNLYSGNYATEAVYSTATFLVPCFGYTYNFQACDIYGCASTATLTGSFQVGAPAPTFPRMLHRG